MSGGFFGGVARGLVLGDQLRESAERRKTQSEAAKLAQEAYAELFGQQPEQQEQAPLLKRILTQGQSEEGPSSAVPNGPMRTREYDPQRGWYTTDAVFRAYDDPATSSADWWKLMQNERYSGVRNAQDYDTALSALGSSGYATDPEYAKKVSSMRPSNPEQVAFLRARQQELINAGVPEHLALLGAQQSAIETGWGKSAPNNNFYGIKGSSRPSAVPASGIQQPQRPAGVQNMSVEQAADVYQRYLLKAAGNPYAMRSLQPMLDYVKNSAIAKHMADYQGDPMTVEGAMGLYRRYGEVSGLFGEVPDPREAMTVATQAEGARRGREKHEWERRDRMDDEAVKESQRLLDIGENAYKLFASGNIEAGTKALDELYPDTFFGQPQQTTRTEGPYTTIDFILPVLDKEGNQVLDEAGKPRTVRLSDASFMLGKMKSETGPTIRNIDVEGEYGEALSKPHLLDPSTGAWLPMPVAKAPGEEKPVAEAPAPKEEGSWLTRLFGGGKEDAPVKKEYPAELQGRRFIRDGVEYVIQGDKAVPVTQADRG